MNELDDAAIVKFVGSRKFDEVAASLAALNDVPTALMARVLEGPRADLLLIPCKSAGLDWLAVEAVLRHRPVDTCDRRQVALAGASRLWTAVAGDRATHGPLLAIA